MYQTHATMLPVARTMDCTARTSQGSFHVLIIGAGACGLVIAQGLKRAGIPFTLFERTQPDTYLSRTRDWSMGLHWGKKHMDDILPPELIDQLPSAETYPDVALTEKQECLQPVLNGATGEIIAGLRAISTRRVSRAKLLRLLGQGLPVQHGMRLVDIRLDAERVTAVFNDGQSYSGNMLIGCDSANSFVRQWLLGQSKARTSDLPITAYNFTQTYTAEQALWLRDQIHPLMKCAPHPSQPTWYILPTLNIGEERDPSTWVFQHFLTEWDERQPSLAPPTSEARLARFKELASNYCEPFRSAAAWVKDNTFIAHGRIKHWPNPTLWDNHRGRVTLAGDAAHPMAPRKFQWYYEHSLRLPFPQIVLKASTMRYRMPLHLCVQWKNSSSLATARDST